jgi:hypothetical protein
MQPFPPTANNMTPNPTSKKMLPARARNPSAKAKAAGDAADTDVDAPAPKKVKKGTKCSKKKVPALEESSDEGLPANKNDVDGEEDKVEVE